MVKELTGKRIVFIVANEGVEEVELTQPWAADPATLVTNRNPDDLEAFCSKPIEAFARSSQEAEAA